ncbi:hypothetical protein SteCoe_19345 [Stentor coeruleus]|uniref:IQ calmodulin-binding motif family protein n=1 Tax=Stentor coeruleus TaxID=5963 RepID=A0A1R2BUB1_9CILI|nr:hypothetical protein SteCoe_19345 [Stentor coeruleus]
MSNKMKSAPTSKKPQNTLPMKEIFQQNQLATEILRLVVSRSEDIAILKSISDRKTGKLRLQSSFAEKTVQEIESKEEWRISKEELVLCQLINAKLETILHKKQFEKLAKKMLKINSQFDEDPTENDMNLSEIHVQKIMNVKVGPENTIITYNEKGQSIVTVPSATVSISVWHECHSQSIKLLEGFLSGEVFSLYPSIYFCVKHSRNNLQNEINRQKQAIEEGASFLTPNIAVIITSKKSKNMLPSIKQGVNQVRKTCLLPEPDFITPLFRMFMDMNSDIDKSIKNHIITYAERNSEDKIRLGKTKDLVEKTIRIRNYEKFSAVNPWVSEIPKFPLNTVRTLQRLQIMPQILFDLENPYFDESRSLADRIKLIHSCIVVQNYFREKKQRLMIRKAIILQKWIRGFLGRKKALLIRTFAFRKVYYWEKLRNWYPLLVNNFRISKNPFNLIDHSNHIRQIIVIQKFVRRWIAKKESKWKKVFYKIRKNKENEKFYMKKQKLWLAGSTNEEMAFSYSTSSEDDIISFIAQNESKQRRHDEKSVIELVKIKEKAEFDIRKKLLGQAKVDRIKALE